MEYRFNVGTGNYRHFIVGANGLKQAIKRFKAVAYPNTMHTSGFRYEDITSIVPLQPNKDETGR